VIPPREERSDDAEQLLAAMSVPNGSRGEPNWDTESRMNNYWEQASAPAEAVPAKLTARVHHQAVRVSFAPDSRAPGQYVVRPLREGERPPVGERVALLVALEPGVPLV
jgi:hypothetical protein